MTNKDQTEKQQVPNGKGKARLMGQAPNWQKVA
jgi:hypothetical protein